MNVLLDKGFDALITFDQNLPYQQNHQLPVAVIVLNAPNNRLDTAKAFVPQVLEVLDQLEIGQFIKIRLDLMS